MPDGDAGRGLCTDQSPSHAKGLGGGGGMGEANKKQIPKGWTLLGTVPPVLGRGTAGSSWSMPSPGLCLNRKGNYQCPPNSHIAGSSLQLSIPPCYLLPPSAPLTSILGQLGDPRAPVPCRHLQPIPSWHPPTKDDCLPSSPIPDMTCLSPHCPQTHSPHCQLPTSTRPCLSPACSPPEQG